MINRHQVLSIHEIVIREYGGAHGLRDESLMISAIERPYAGFGDTEFYPTPEEKAAAIFESIVKNHPFTDGNKRTGYVLMRLMLLQAGKDIRATQEEKYEIVIKIASGQIDYPEILAWIRTHTI